MSRDTIIDDQNRRTQALFESLLSPTVASDATQEAADAEFATYLGLTMDNVIDDLDLEPDLMGILKVLHKNHKDVYMAILAKPEFDDGGFESVAVRLIRAIAEAVPKGTVLRAYREL